MKHAIISLFFLVSSLLAETFSPTVEYFGVERVNWSVQPTVVGGEVRVGQYIRDFNVGWDSEVLFKFDHSGITGTVTDVEITLDITEANVGPSYGNYTPTLELFKQNKGSLNSSVVYTSFALNAWTDRLLSKDISATADYSQLVLKSVELTNLVKAWVNGSATNNGLTLISDLRYFDFFLNMDGIKVTITTTADPVVLTEVEETFSLQNFHTHWVASSDLIVTQNTQIKDVGRASSVQITTNNPMLPNLITVFDTDGILNVGDSLKMRIFNPNRAFFLSFAIAGTPIPTYNLVEIPISGNMTEFQTISTALGAAKTALNANHQNINMRVWFPNSAGQLTFYIDQITFPGSEAVK